MAQTKSNDLVAMLGSYFEKAPALPANIREVLVKIAPWLALIGGILGLLSGIGALGFSPLAMFGGPHMGMMFLVSGILTIVVSIMLLMAFPKLSKQQMGGWMLLFWVEVINLLSLLVVFNLIGFIIGGLIGFYLLFQVKSYYK